MNSASEKTWPWALALCAGVLLAHGSGFFGTFLYDDHQGILDNPALANPWNLRKAMFDFPDTTRPVVGLTLAVDRIFWGTDARGYHDFNFAGHLAAALLLFGIVRRTLLSAKLKDVFGACAAPLAFAVSLLWSLHPLQTEAVTYLIQRAEVLMGMFFLLALYAMIRGAEAEKENRGAWWNMLAIVAGLLGAGCKQVIVVLPLVALLYDRCFISGTFRRVLGRARIHLGFCAVWLVIGLLLWMTPRERFGSAGFGMEKITPLSYALSQFVVLVHYLKLVFWPVGQVLDYVWMVERDYTRIVPCAVVILALLGLTIWSVIRNRAAGFCGAWVFLILAPTSTILPIGDLAAERRMYLPLAGLVVLLVCGAFAFIRRKLEAGRAVHIVAAAAILLAFGLGVFTVKRNNLYRDEMTMWEDVLSKRPRNPRALLFVGNRELEQGNLAPASERIRNAVEIQPRYHEAQASLGALLLAEGRAGPAEAAFRKALSIHPAHARSWKGLADALTIQHRIPEALSARQQAAEAAPNDARYQIDLAQLAFDTGNYPEAIKGFSAALRLKPDAVEMHNSLGSALAIVGNLPGALHEFDEVLKREPNHPLALFNRAKAFELTGRWADAVRDYRASAAANPKAAGARAALAWLIITHPNDALGTADEALRAAQEACNLDGNKDPLTLDTLAVVQAANGAYTQAAETADRAAALLPPDNALGREITGHAALFRFGKALPATLRAAPKP